MKERLIGLIKTYILFVCIFILQKPLFYTLLQFFVCRNFLDRPFQDYLEWFTARPLACRIFNGYSRTILHSVRLDTFQGTPPYLERLLLLHRYFARCHFHC